MRKTRSMETFSPRDLRDAARRQDLIAAAHERQAVKYRTEARELRTAAARLARTPKASDFSEKVETTDSVKSRGSQ
jgi:F420-dependent methylenetetrahydromethanopterin dehydrogenase